jgi:hypothetical protein
VTTEEALERALGALREIVEMEGNGVSDNLVFIDALQVADDALEEIQKGQWIASVGNYTTFVNLATGQKRIHYWGDR